MYSRIGDGEKANESSLMTLNLDIEIENPGGRTRADGPRTLNLASGFQTQDTIGGHSDATLPLVKNEKVNADIKEMEVMDSSEDEDPFVAAEGMLLKKL